MFLIPSLIFQTALQQTIELVIAIELVSHQLTPTTPPRSTANPPAELVQPHSLINFHSVSTNRFGGLERFVSASRLPFFFLHIAALTLSARDSTTTSRQ